MRTIQAFFLIACLLVASAHCQKDTPIYQCVNNLLEVAKVASDLAARGDFKLNLGLVAMIKDTIKICEVAVKKIDWSKLVRSAMKGPVATGRSAPEADPVKVNTYNCQNTMLDSYNALNSCKGTIFGFPLDFKKVINELLKSGLDYSRLKTACA